MPNEQYSPLDTQLSPDVHQALSEMLKIGVWPESVVIAHLLSPSNLHRVITYYTYDKLMNTSKKTYSRDYIFHINAKITQQLQKRTGRTVTIQSPGSQYANGFGLVDPTSPYFSEATLYDRVNQSLSLELMELAETEPQTWQWVQVENLLFAFPELHLGNFPTPITAIISELGRGAVSQATLPLLMGPTQKEILRVFATNGGYVDEKLFASQGHPTRGFRAGIGDVATTLENATGRSIIETLTGKGYTMRGEGMPRAKVVETTINNLPPDKRELIFRRGEIIFLDEKQKERVAILCESLDQLAEDLNIEWPFVVSGRTPYIVIIASFDGDIIVEVSEREAEIIQAFEGSIELDFKQTGIKGSSGRKRYRALLDRIFDMGYQVEPDTGLIRDDGVVVLPVLSKQQGYNRRRGYYT